MQEHNITPGISFEKRQVKGRKFKPFKLFSPLEELASRYFDEFDIRKSIEQNDIEFEKKYLVTIKGQRGWKI